MKIRIDGVEYSVTEGKNLLETCLGLGLDLPYFCWHPAMGSIGACRQCAMLQFQDEEDTRGRLVMACMTPVSDGAILSLAGERASRFRRGIIESLMINHPHDCPVCAEGGECHLQDMTLMTGHRDRRYRGRKKTYRNQYLGPLVHHEMNRCITCYRCTRFYQDVAGGRDLVAQACHDHIFFGRQEDGILESEFAGNLVEVCPTGVFTDKALVHDYTRKWDLQSAPSVCTGCAAGCNTLPGERYGKVKRVHNRYNAAVNGYFLCDRGRFGAGYVNHADRLEYPGLRREDGRFDAVDHHTALTYLGQSLAEQRVAAVGSPRASVEANYLLRLLSGGADFCPGASKRQQRLAATALQLARSTPAHTPDIAEMEAADAVLILGEDVTNTAPRIALSLRQSVRNRAYALAESLQLLPWQDAAIRNLAQDQRSPLAIADVAATRLDDVASHSLQLTPEEIARLGQDIAAHLRGATSPGTQAAEIADLLSAAERPLIIAGSGLEDAAPMQAAAEVATALGERGAQVMFSLVLPEANSLGQAMLCEGQVSPPDLDELASRARRGEIDTLLVLENDLYQRADPALVQDLLQHCPRVISLDGLDNPTTSASHLVLPAASPLESEGTLVSLSGRAQRHFPVFQPAGERRPAWVWLLAAAREVGLAETADWQHFDDITRGCAAAVPALAAMPRAAPDHLFRRAGGVRVPRQPLRYSGRTAMRADRSVHEPRQPRDEESALGFTMEGLNRDTPGALLPFVWSPGWNSNQSLHRFQEEVGGALKGGSAGVRLLEAGNNGQAGAAPTTSALAGTGGNGSLRLVPRYHIFGSDPLSALSPGIRELVRPACIELAPDDARALGVADGDGVRIGEFPTPLAVRVNASLVAGCAGFSAGYPATAHLHGGQRVDLQRAADFVPPPPTLIGSDREGQHG